MEQLRQSDLDRNHIIVLDEPLDLDDLLPVLGEFGRYQKLLLWLICLPACIPCGFCAFNQLFMTDTPDDYWCNVPQLNEFNLTDEQIRNLAIPSTEENGVTQHSKCSRYAIDWKNLFNISDPDSIVLQSNTSWPIEYCYNGWIYNKTHVTSSIVIDFDLVCDYDIYPTIGLSALNVGGPIGVYLFGILNDRAGRRIAYFTCLATMIVGSLITTLSVNFWMWCVSRVIVGLTIPAVYQIPFIIALELVGPDYRSFVTSMTCTFYTFGIMMLAGVAYLVTNWVEMSLYTSLPFIFYFLYIFVMPESPRWLLAQGKFEDALNILEIMARVNGNKLPNSFRQKLHERVEANKMRVKEKTKSFNSIDLCRTPNMRLKTLLITLNWFANETVYLGLSYYGPSLGDNQHLSFFLSSLVEIPSYLCCWFIMDRCGRRWPMCLLMILSGIFCIVTVLVPDDAVLETLIIFLLSKTMISASFLIIYPFAGELYPTEVRGVGIGTSSYIGGLGLIVIPFINYLGKENLRLPLIVMGFISIFGGITGFRLPETLHYRLPQTLEEGEEFGKEWDLEDCCRCIPTKPQPSNDASYENIDNLPQELELHTLERSMLLEPDDISEIERVPLDTQHRRPSMKLLVRQASTVNTQKAEGAMKLTYWF